MSRLHIVKNNAVQNTVKWRAWVARLKSYAMAEAEMVPDLTADYWRECFDSSMPPEIAFRESFVEQDGL